MSAASSRVPSPPTCPWCRPRSSSWSSTRRPPASSASKCRLCCSPAPMRSSNEAAPVHSAARRCYGHELDAVRGMPPRDISIAVVGGGIGGLTAAISLLQAGFDVQVYEQARWLSEVGAGINIGPNASRLLIRLGLDPELAKVAFRSPFFHQRRWQDGRTLTRTPLGQAIEA